VGYCIVHNPLLLQPLRHWFTFIFRKYEHLAVGSWGKGLTDSRGSFPLGLPYPPLLYLDYSTHLAICQDLFYFFTGGATRTHIIPVADSTDDTSRRWENPTRTGGVAFWRTPRNRSTPSVFCTCIIAHPKPFVNRFGTINKLFF
jgi:hypothetical protein